jgi:hypothetical protein
MGRPSRARARLHRAHGARPPPPGGRKERRRGGEMEGGGAPPPGKVRGE